MTTFASITRRLHFVNAWSHVTRALLRECWRQRKMWPRRGLGGTLCKQWRDLAARDKRTESSR
eukprot:scaffold289114_cov31-Tisochrysis_lutea.AAC.4